MKFFFQPADFCRHTMADGSADGQGRAARAPREEGYVLLAVLFMAFLLALSLSVAASRMASDIERDHERELIQRGLQYQRAVQLYYRKFGAYPPTVDALVKTTDIRFLRKRYKDPITGQDDWVPIHFGEAKTPTIGFFGQPLAGASSGGASSVGGVGPSGGNSNPGASMAGAGNSSTSGFSLGSSSMGSPGGGMGGAPGGAPGASSSPTGGSTFGSNSPSDFGSSGSSQTFGGAGIIGFKIPSNKLAILEFKKQKHFNEWEFYYDPMAEQFLSGNAALGQPIPTAGDTSATGFGGSSTGGSAPGAAGSSGFGTSPSSGFSSGPSSTFGGNSSSGFGGSSSSGFGGSSSGGFGGSSSPSPSQPQ